MAPLDICCGVLLGHYKAMHIPFAQFGLFGSADTARVRLENDTDDSSFYFTFCLEYGSRLGA